MRIESPDWEMQLDLLYEHYAEDRYIDALRLLNQMKQYRKGKVLPRRLEVDLLLIEADSLLELHRWRRTIAVYRKLLTDYGDRLGQRRLSNAYCHLAQALFMRNNLAESAQMGGMAVVINPRNAIAYKNLGLAYLRLRRWPEASEAFTEAVRIRKRYCSAYIGLGDAELRKGFPLAAEESYRKAASIEPDDYWACRGLKLAQARIKKKRGFVGG